MERVFAHDIELKCSAHIEFSSKYRWEVICYTYVCGPLYIISRIFTKLSWKKLNQ